ncbi:DNA-binding winged helix-turn-helix (wHTH) protein [Rhizobium sp. SG_E_25_P2]|uniref:winged helix-turn-helix domain-containing protein n=1 Tax=Rhizobium sp. SG_E_25_P2 TaxID=2879942 RepID=UPI0024738C10|nr:winged helix-turn-helix domain-containing protein [Rhizobium sp. SG_E_25_P2]MDH6268131.1 DNA-binding winged helix-turn-helix (wHTH) protein [Rhizobium sp. SG_E_25_P2]
MDLVSSGEKTQGLDFGQLQIDPECMFVHRNGRTVRFTRSERALLLALIGNPRRLMSRSRLLDEIATRISEPSDRNIDFLVNRLRSKLGDNAKAPAFIATQYGEGYLWIATPAPPPPLDAFLVIDLTSELDGHPFRRQASVLMDRLQDALSAGIGPVRKVANLDKLLRVVPEKSRYSLQVSFHADHGRLSSAAALREMPSKRIMKTFRLQLDVEDDASFAAEALRVSAGVVDALEQAQKEASSGLGISEDDAIEARFESASKLLSADNPKWLAKGDLLGKIRQQNPQDSDAALQWCLHLFSKLVLTEPFAGMRLEERDRTETEIESTVLDCLPGIGSNPLLMLAAAKLLYFINRGHLDLAEEIAERAFPPTQDFTAALPILGQLKYARGRYDEAVKLFDRGIDLATPGSEFHWHMRVLKCLALVAAGHSGASAAQATDIGNFGAGSLREINLMLGWMTASPDLPLPPASETALKELGAAGAARGLEYLYFSSARHITLETGRSNVMRAMIAHVSRLHGRQAIPDLVLRGVGAAPSS